MNILKLCLITALVLEVLAIITHFNVLLKIAGNVVYAFMPIFIIAGAIVWMVKRIF